MVRNKNNFENLNHLLCRAELFNINIEDWNFQIIKDWNLNIHLLLKFQI